MEGNEGRTGVGVGTGEEVSWQGYRPDRFVGGRVLEGVAAEHEPRVVLALLFAVRIPSFGRGAATPLLNRGLITKANIL